MKKSFFVLIFVLWIASWSSFRAHAQTNNVRETLKQYVVDLQKNPDDQSLRERIIKLSQELKPAPAIPEEARRHYVKADALIHDAKSPQEAGVAVEEYNKALLEAPWWPDAYRDLGVALEVAGRYEDAKKALKLYLLSHPGEDESRKAQDEIYRIEAKEDSVARKQREEEAVARRKQQEEADATQKARESASLSESLLGGTWKFVLETHFDDGRCCSDSGPPRFPVRFSKSGSTISGNFNNDGIKLQGDIADPDRIINWQALLNVCDREVWVPVSPEISPDKKTIRYSAPYKDEDRKGHCVRKGSLLMVMTRE
jgi:hypothetical protein